MDNMIEPSEIGELIKQLRIDRNWTQADVAKKLWTDPQTVDEWEHGVDMSFVDVVSVLRLLGAKIMIRLPGKPWPDD